jgi:hypothetical protein
MNKTIIVISLLLAATAATTTTAQRWQQKVDYAIDVTLTDSTHSLDGDIRIQYINHSPDTLPYIWIRIWPNAFRNDRTAFSEQLILTGRTDFYFSDKTQKGYINRLQFRAGGQLARMEDHPQYIDVIKVVLPIPLLPKDTAILTTPFHVRLPDNFSHNGYHQGVYEVTQWYPRPAIYDPSGWHPDPYLEQGGSYNDFGDFDVNITVPSNFVIAATARPQTPPTPPTDPDSLTTTPSASPPTNPATKTLHYHQSNINDFVWFAGRRFHTTTDTLRLPSGRIIELDSYTLPHAGSDWKYSLKFLKEAIRFHSTLLGDYPFDVASVVETRPNTGHPLHYSSASLSGASWPAIIGINTHDSDYFNLDMTIEKGISNNWLSFSVSPDARRFPWMTEGIGQYYYDRYRLRKYGPPFLEYFTPDTFHRSLVNTRVVLREAQPVNTPSEDFAPQNYHVIGADETAIWLLELQRALGLPLFDSCMHQYFLHHEFLHAHPADLKAAFADVMSRNTPSAPHLNLDSAFALLDTISPVPPNPFHRLLRVNPQFIPHPTTYNRLNISPALGFNDYDHLMIGAMIHNYNLPPTNWQILAAPLYSTVSHQFNGLAHVNYAWYPHSAFRLIEAGVNGSRFSTISGTDSGSRAIYGGFYKIAPYIRLFFRKPTASSTQLRSLEAKTFLIGEKGFSNYVLKSTDSLYYPTVAKYDFRYLNQLTYTIQNSRVLYPYTVRLQAQQAAPFYRVNLNVNYFFNYSTGGGLDVRLFGAKFGYLGTRNPAVDLTQFEPKLTAVRGVDDYTYDNYFVGRNEYNGLASQQIMMRDGDLKIRTDLFQDLQGRSDDWVAAVNLNSTLPPQLVPAWMPLRLFLDIGTYAQAWSDNPPTRHFLYTGGVELCLLDKALRIYIPLVYSSDFSNQLKTVPGQNGFFQKISFSIDLRQLPVRKYLGYTPF